MEDRKLSEKESLDIITQMINSSKRNMKVGSGNVLLYLGYFTVFLSVVISSLIVYTQNYIWSWGWMLMFAVGPVISYKQSITPRSKYCNDFLLVEEVSV